MAYTKEVKPTTSNSLDAKQTASHTPVTKPTTTNSKVAKPTASHVLLEKEVATYADVAKPTASYGLGAKPVATHTPVAEAVATFVRHLYAALLCEDGSYLLQENGARINLEWYHTKDTKPTTSNTDSVKPVTTWNY